MIDLQPLGDPSFWFQLQPNYLSPVFEKAFFLLFGIMVILGAIVRIVARQKKHDKFVSRIFGAAGTMLLTMGVLGVAWFFFTFEAIYILGARFWFLLWFIGLIVWIVSIVRFAKIRVPEMKEIQKKKSESNKYLPRKKKR